MRGLHLVRSFALLLAQALAPAAPCAPPASTLLAPRTSAVWAHSVRCAPACCLKVGLDCPRNTPNRTEASPHRYLTVDIVRAMHACAVQADKGISNRAVHARVSPHFPSSPRSIDAQPCRRRRAQESRRLRVCDAMIWPVIRETNERSIPARFAWRSNVHLKVHTKQHSFETLCRSL